MEIRYDKWYSSSLGREMELKTYGERGKPVLYIPCQNGRFYDFENFKMLDAWAPFIEQGMVWVISVDTIDSETWSNKSGNPYLRIRRHEQWVQYLLKEVVPYIHSLQRARGQAESGIMAFGCSLGATHAANLFFRRPDEFDGLLALSGIYTASYGFGDYMDDLVYLNSPVDYLAGMPKDHPYIARYNNNRGIIVVGTGPWEVPETTFRVGDLCSQKGIQVWVDVWGSDCAHDWDWWYKQAAYHVPHLLD
jgi:esterase/lipase superfamily enzyme